MSNPADTGTSREGDPYAEIAALKQRVAELERERDDAVRFRDEWQRVYFELIEAIGSSPVSSEPPVGVALELRAKLDTLTKELAAARKVCEELDWVPLHNPPSDGLESALTAYRATQTKEQSDEKAE